MKTRNKYIMTLMAFLLIIFLATPVTVFAAAEPTVNLGTTESFAVLAGSAVTNTGSTVISGSAGGDVGLYPGLAAAVTGFPPGTISDGTIHAGDAVAQQAQTDLTTAYNDAAGRTVTTTLTGQNLGGLTLTSGVYFFASSADLTGELTLDAEGNPDAAFIFQIGSTLTTASASSVTLINGAQYCRVFWQVTSSATLGTNSQFIGHILALTSITATTGAEVQGQLLARNGAVTLDSNTITNGVCAAPTPTTGATSETSATSTDSETSATSTDTDETTATSATSTATEATTAVDTTESTTTDNDDEEIAKTGESDQSILIGIILLSLAGVLTYVVRRRKAQ